jgi:hypothetical protein
LFVTLTLATCTFVSVGIPLSDFQLDPLETVRQRAFKRTIEGLIEAGRFG